MSSQHPARALLLVSLLSGCQLLIGITDRSSDGNGGSGNGNGGSNDGKGGKSGDSGGRTGGGGSGPGAGGSAEGGFAEAGAGGVIEGGTSAGGNAPTTGGVGNDATGGVTTNTGGSSEEAGSSAGGSANTGGKSTTGGASSTTGGAPPTTGGKSGTGGASGGTSTGGTATGGAPPVLTLKGDDERVKVSAGGKEYVIRNNNYGSPATTNQELSYASNTFIITASNATASSGEPIAFPSIYIGKNGVGAPNTSASDNLPRRIPEIVSIPTTFEFGNPGSTNAYNVVFDIWFAASAPAGSYTAPASGEVMLWLYKPPGHVPIGANVSQSTIAGTVWQVWSGNGVGDGTQYPVVTFVRSGATATNVSLDLKLFINAATNLPGTIGGNWYVTDIFAGFEVWDGAGAVGAGVKSFTVSVN